MTRSGSYGENSIITFVAAILNLALGIFLSVIIARALGPEGKGVYAITTLFSYLIVMFGSLGLPSAATFYVAKQSYARQEILGNTVLASFLTGALGMIIGLIIAISIGQYIFPDISQKYLMLALLIIPGNMLLIHLQYVLLGAQHIKGYNFASVVQCLFSLVLTMLFLWIFRMGISGALIALVLSWIFANIFAFALAVKISDGIKLRMNPSYIKNALKYGLQIYISNILRFLSLRVNLFLVNGFLNPTAAGFYSISVGLTEKLWLISQAAATVLFPKIAAEEDEVQKKEFTPIIARTVLWITILVALIIFLLSQWLIGFLYSPVFLPAVAPLRILLLGTVAAGLSQVLGNDIAGRGRPILNVYANIAGFISLVFLSVLWIPRYGIEGAAWASTISYISNLTITIFLYARISGNSLRAIILPEKTDWILYSKMGKTLWQWVGNKIK